MARRRSNNDRFVAILILGAFALAAIYNFYVQNQETINSIFIWSGILIGIVVVSVIGFKMYIKNKDRLAYLKTPYFMETKLSYRKYKETRGRMFEGHVYNAIRSTIGGDFPMMTNLSLPQANAVNIDSQVDIIVFHSTGIYVIEVKDYSGPLIGRLDEDIWKPFIPKKVRNKKNKKFEEIYELNYGLYNSFLRSGHSNPVRQNEIHINTLNQLVEADFKNIVIFSEKMFVDNGNGPKSMIQNVMGIDDFVDLLKSARFEYNLMELKDMYERVRSFNRQSDSQEKLHIARVK